MLPVMLHTFDSDAQKRNLSGLLCNAISSSPSKVSLLSIACIGYTTDEGKLIVFQCQQSLLPTPKNSSLFCIRALIPVSTILDTDSEGMCKAFSFTKDEIKCDHVMCEIYCMVDAQALGKFTTILDSSTPVPYENLIQHITLKYTQLTRHKLELCDIVKCMDKYVEIKGIHDLYKEKLAQLVRINHHLSKEICDKLAENPVSFIRCIGNTPSTRLIVNLQCPLDLLPAPKNDSLFIIRLNVPLSIITSNASLASVFKLAKSEKQNTYITCDMYCLVTKSNLTCFIESCDDLDNKPKLKNIIQHCFVKCIRLYTQELLSLQLKEEDLINEVGLCNATFAYEHKIISDNSEEIEHKANKTLCKILPTLCMVHKGDFLIKKLRCIGNTVNNQLTIYPSTHIKQCLPNPPGTSLFLIRTRILTLIVLNTPELNKLYDLNKEEMASKYLLCDAYCIVLEKDLEQFKNTCKKSKLLSDCICTCDIRYIRIYTKCNEKLIFDEMRALQKLGNIEGTFLTGEEAQLSCKVKVCTSKTSDSSSAVSNDESSLPSYVSVKYSLKSKLLHLRKHLKPESSSSASASVSGEDDIDTQEEAMQRKQHRLLKLEKLRKEEEQEEDEDGISVAALSEQKLSHHTTSQSKELG